MMWRFAVELHVSSKNEDGEPCHAAGRRSKGNANWYNASWVTAAPPALPKVHTHRMCEFLNQFVRSLSSYYGPSGVRILPSADGKQGGGAAMAGRIYLCKAFFSAWLSQRVA